jgi:hypothetical protein
MRTMQRRQTHGRVHDVRGCLHASTHSSRAACLACPPPPQLGCSRGRSRGSGAATSESQQTCRGPPAPPSTIGAWCDALFYFGKGADAR